MNDLINIKKEIRKGQDYDIVFYICNPKSKNFLKTKKMMKLANGYFENKETKEYYAFFNIEKDKVALIKEIHLNVFNWKSASIFIKGVPTISFKDLEYWFDCYLDSVINNIDCNFIGDIYSKYPYHYLIEGCFNLPCNINKNANWYDVNSSTDAKTQYLNYSIQGFAKCSLCPKFKIEKFKQLKSNNEIKKEHVYNKEHPFSFEYLLKNIVISLLKSEPLWKKFYNKYIKK